MSNTKQKALEELQQVVGGLADEIKAARDEHTKQQEVRRVEAEDKAARKRRYNDAFARVQKDAVEILKAVEPSFSAAGGEPKLGTLAGDDVRIERYLCKNLIALKFLAPKSLKGDKTYREVAFWRAALGVVSGEIPEDEVMLTITANVAKDARKVIETFDPTDPKVDQTWLTERLKSAIQQFSK